MSMIDLPQAPTFTGLADASVPPRPTSIPTVLIVDDSPVDRRRTSGLVARRGDLRAIVASDGHEAMEQIARDEPAVVVTDLQMPGMDGLELVQEIRRLHPGLPVVLMTAYGSEDIAIKALRAGAAQYVPKRMMARVLVETLDAVLALAAFDSRRRRLQSCVETSRSSFLLENDPELIAPFIALLQEDLDGLGLCDGNARTRVGVALQEALANALYHGNLEVSSDLRQSDERLFYAEANRRRGDEPYRSRRIHVTADLDRDRAIYRILDDGPGFDTSRLDAPFDPESLMRVGGRGLLLIRTFMDETRHNQAGNEITLVKLRAR
jgi:CheY-like chemotaxis protein